MTFGTYSPASATINNQKRDKIPSVATLLANKERILHYWHLLHQSDYKNLFKESREIRSSVKTTIYDRLLWLPESKYTDEDVSSRSIQVYQHIYSYAGF